MDRRKNEENVRFLGSNSFSDNGFRDKLIESGMRNVYFISKKYVCEGVSLSDLIQEGCIGLIRAADSGKYDSGKCSFENFSF